MSNRTKLIVLAQIVGMAALFVLGSMAFGTPEVTNCLSACAQGHP